MSVAMHECHLAISLEAKNTKSAEAEALIDTEYTIDNTVSNDVEQGNLLSKEWLHFIGISIIMMIFLPFVVPESQNVLKESESETTNGNQ